MTLNYSHFAASKPSSSVARIRCPVEETGRNSVTPSTMPRMIAISSNGIGQAVGAQVGRGQINSPAGELAALGESGRAIPSPTAASGVGLIPNASSPGSSPDGTLSRCSISHWSRVSGAPGSQPSRDSRLPAKSGHRRQVRLLPGDLEDRAVKLDHAHHLRPADLVSLAAEALRIERGHGDRLGEIADIDRLEIALARRSPGGTASRAMAAKRLVRSSSGPNTSDGRTIVACGKRLAHRLLALGLGAAVGGLRLEAGADRRDLDQRPDAEFRRHLGDVARAFDVHGAHLRAEDAAQIYDRGGAVNGVADAVAIGDVRASRSRTDRPARAAG